MVENQIEKYLASLPPRYRDANLLFTWYASFPGVFQPDLLYKLWQNFKAYKKNKQNRSLPFVVISDLIQAPFCREVGSELYEIEEDVQKYIIQNSEELFAKRKLESLFTQKQIAALLYQYADKFLMHPHQKLLRDIYFWKALVNYDANYAGHKLAEDLKKYQDNFNPSPEQYRLLLQIGDLQNRFTESSDVEAKFAKYPTLSNNPSINNLLNFEIKDEPSKKSLLRRFKDQITGNTQQVQEANKKQIKYKKVIRETTKNNTPRKKLLALLVGIDTYHPASKGVPNLKGSVNDVEAFERLIRKHYIHLNPQIRKLTNSEATRENIVSGFRNHLCSQTDENTVVFFVFSGHGSYQATAKIFEQYNASVKREETIVCYDSRIPEGWDLAHIELAILLEEISQKGAQIIVLLDCCHASKGTNLSQISTNWTTNRPLDSYLDSYYHKQLMETGQVIIPKSSRILLAACQYDQQAREMHRDGKTQGLFSYTLISTLESHLSKGFDISYSQLFEEIKVRLRKEAIDQTPIFNADEFFNYDASFLDNKHFTKNEYTKRFLVYYYKNSWQVNVGAAYGLTPEQAKNGFIIFNDRTSKTVLAQGKVTQLKSNEAKLELIEDDKLNTNLFYYAQLSRARDSSMDISVSSIDTTKVKELIEVTKNYNSPYISLWDKDIKSDYQVHIAPTEIFVYKYDKMIIRYFLEEISLQSLILELEKIAQWERLQDLRNNYAQIDTDDVIFNLYLGEESNEAISTDEVHVRSQKNKYFNKSGYEWMIPYRIEAQNNSEQDLYFMLLYFAPDYSIQVYFNEKIEAYSAPLILKDNYGLNPGEEDEITGIFKLIVSTEELESYMFQQTGLIKPKSYVK